MSLTLARKGLQLYNSPMVPKEVRHANVRRWIAAMQYLHARNLHTISKGSAFVYTPGKMRDPDPPPKAENVTAIKRREAK